jgi:hypothetical protein
MKDDEPHSLFHADRDMIVGRRRAERRRVVQEIDTEEAACLRRDHPDQFLCACRRLDRVPEDADAAGIRDRGHQWRVRHESHSSADERIPHSVRARQPRVQGKGGDGVVGRGVARHLR